MRRIANATVHQVGMVLLVNGLAITLTRNVVLILREFLLIFVQYMEVYRFPKNLGIHRSQEPGSNGKGRDGPSLMVLGYSD